MGFLITQILGLLALAALAGGAFMHWWTRRQYTDVSYELTELRRQAGALDREREGRAKAERTADEVAARASHLEESVAAEVEARKNMEARLERELASERAWRSEAKAGLDAIAALSLDPVTERLTGVESRLDAEFAAVKEQVERVHRAVGSIAIPDLGTIEAGIARVANLAPLESRVERLANAVDSLETPDLQPLTNSVADVGRAVGDVDKRVQSIRSPGLSAVERNLAAVSSRVESMNEQFARLDAPDLSGIERDLSIVSGRVHALDERVAALRNADLSGLERGLGSVRSHVERVESKIRPPSAPDLTGVNRRLDALTQQLAAVAARPAPQKPGANLLRSPSRGKPDDLKKIRGIGPKLERMLHRLGVYYFWQVAEWQKADIRHVDEKLEVFHGRIERDAWVRQAKSLARSSKAAV